MVSQSKNKSSKKKGLEKATQIKGKDIKEKQKHQEQHMPPSREQALVQSQHFLGAINSGAGRVCSECSGCLTTAQI